MEDRRAEILSAAFGEFAAKGFKAATIKSIAGAAKLQSPALIYWYFADKEALFREVLASQVPVIRAVSDPDAVMDLEPEELLRRVGASYLGFQEDGIKAGLQLTVGEAIRNPEIAEVFVRNGPGRVIRVLETYFDARIGQGKLRPHDTRVSARSFIGMLIPRVAGNLFLPTLNENGPTDEEYLETCIDTFLRGLGTED